jgi:hypothetical protein
VRGIARVELERALQVLQGLLPLRGEGQLAPRVELRQPLPG